jgi:anti-sigma regulatory factor (Ser/Thr protein kinase)
MNDEIILTLPEQPAFHDVAHLVVGGLAVRLNLTFENLEDLQTALDGLLPRVGGEVTVAVRLQDGTVNVTVGPFACDPLRAELGRQDTEGVGLRRVLETVADTLDVVEGEGSCWVRLTKAVTAVPEG